MLRPLPRPLPIRSPARRLREARADHARCLRLAAWYRELHRRGEPGNRDRHAWALDQARLLRGQFAELSAAHAMLHSEAAQ